MNLANTIIYGGGPGSGCNPDVGVCGRPPGSGNKERDASPSDDPIGLSVSKKFERYEKMVKAVANKKVNGLAVFGERGIGKSKTVIDVLENEGKEAVKIRGQITPKELFNTLSNNRDEDSIVWFDDADSAFKDTTALNILKAALDSDEPREISWLSSKKGDEDEEQTFRFRGRIIVTTNIELDKNEHVAALTDRMHWINLKLSADEKMHRIEQVASKMLQKDPRLNLDDKTTKEVVKWVKDNRAEIGDNLSLRVVKKIGELASFDPDWKDMAQSFIEETNKITPTKTTFREPTPGERPSSRPTEGRPKAPTQLGDKTPKKYDNIARKHGFAHTGGNSYESDKAKITFDGSNWRITPVKGKERTGKGAPALRALLPSFSASARRIPTVQPYTPGRWSSVHESYV